MDRLQIDAEHVVARYLAGQLSSAEENGFEDYVASHPEIFREIESTLRMKEGLAVLRDRGELAALLRGRDWRPSFAAAAAAVLVVLALGVWSWRHAAAPMAPVLAGLPGFVGHDSGSLPIFATYTLIRSRGESADVDIQLPAQHAAIQIKILPSVFVTQGRYRATLQRIGADGEKSLVRDIDGLQAAGDRFVTLYLDSAQLTPGSYEISLAQADSSAASEADRFRLHCNGG
jgi:hypothetical protein